MHEGGGRRGGRPRSAGTPRPRGGVAVTVREPFVGGAPSTHLLLLLLLYHAAERAVPPVHRGTPPFRGRAVTARQGRERRLPRDLPVPGARPLPQRRATSRVPAAAAGTDQARSRPLVVVRLSLRNRVVLVRQRRPADGRVVQRGVVQDSGRRRRRVCPAPAATAAQVELTTGGGRLIVRHRRQPPVPLREQAAARRDGGRVRRRAPRRGRSGVDVDGSVPEAGRRHRAAADHAGSCHPGARSCCRFNEQRRRTPDISRGQKRSAAGGSAPHRGRSRKSKKHVHSPGAAASYPRLAAP